MRIQITIIILFFASIVQSGFGLKCFQCNPQNETMCGDPFSNSSIIECVGPNDVCVKLVSRNAANMSSMAVGRTCSYLGSQACNKARDRLSLLGNKLTFCKTCDTDFCNGVQAKTALPLLVTLFTLITLRNYII